MDGEGEQREHGGKKEDEPGQHDDLKEINRIPGKAKWAGGDQRSAFAGFDAHPPVLAHRGITPKRSSVSAQHERNAEKGD